MADDRDSIADGDDACIDRAVSPAPSKQSRHEDYTLRDEFRTIADDIRDRFKIPHDLRLRTNWTAWGMSVPIVHLFHDAVKQSYLHNAYVLKFMDDNDSQQIVDEELFWEFKTVFKDWTINMWMATLAAKHLKRFLRTRGVYTGPVYEPAANQMITLNEATQMPEWPDAAIADTTIVSESKLYSLSKEGRKRVPYIATYPSLSFSSDGRTNLIPEKPAVQTHSPLLSRGSDKTTMPAKVTIPQPAQQAQVLSPRINLSSYGLGSRTNSPAASKWRL
jgi:hypothetical protein